MCIFRATVSAVSCLVVPAFICIDLLISCALKLNDDDDDDGDLLSQRLVVASIFGRVRYMFDAFFSALFVLIPC